MTTGDKRDAQFDPLPEPGPPFAPGDEVAFFPVQISPLGHPEDPGWLAWDYAVIDAVDPKTEVVLYHFVRGPNERRQMEMENVVRRSPAYYRWRQAFEAGLAETGDPREAMSSTSELRRRVVAEHPTEGAWLSGARTARDIPQP